MQKTERFWELDFLRGTAIIMMIIFHALFDLYYFGIIELSLAGFWGFFQKIIAVIFISLVGICLTISYSRAKREKTQIQLFLKYLKRGSKIFGLGLIITLATLIFLEKGFIFFGILHFIGISIILAYFFLEIKIWNLILGTLLIINGLFLNKMLFSFKFLVWMGFPYFGLYTLDYFPLLPWFGLVLIGIFFGNMLYPDAKRIFKIRELGNKPIIKQINFLGRNSLIVYFLHQPILILLIYLLL